MWGRCWGFALCISGRAWMVAGGAHARRRVIAVVVVVASGFGCVGLASAENGHLAGSRVLASGQPLRVQRLGRRNPETLAVLRATKKARTRQHARTKKASKVARRRSRSEYRRLTGREALALGQRTFRLAFSTPAFNAATPVPGVRRVRGVSAHAEVVSRQLAGGSTLTSHARASASTAGVAASGRQLLVSTSPLTSNGQPVNLAVTAMGGGFQARNPLVPVTIAGSLQGGVTFPNADFGFALQASGSDKPIQTASGVFFANAGGAANATDFEVNANPAGAETFLQIRSASSPQSYVMHFNLPAGAHLEVAQTDHPIPHDPPTAIEIVQGDKPLGYVYQPNAVDATGAPVPAHATIDGSNVVLSVSDQGPGVEYPVLLDPLVAAQNSYVCNAGWTPWPGWTFAEWDTYENPSLQWWFGQAVDNCSYYPGLYVSMPTNNPFQAGNYGAYEITAPAGAYISDAGWGGSTHFPLASALLMGLYEPAQGVFESGVSNFNGSSWASGNPVDYQQQIVNQLVAVCTSQCPAPAVGGNEAMFGIQATVTVYTSLQRAIVGTESASVLLGDVNPPTVTGLPASTTGWVNDSGKTYPGTVTFQASGLGVQSITYPGSGLTPTTVTNTGCGDPYTAPCLTQPLPENYSFTLPEGVTHVTASATDPVGTTTTETSVMNIDRTPPPAPGTSGLNSGDEFFAASPEILTITPTDPPAPGATASSGPATVSISLDGGAATTLPCTSQCSWTPSAGLPAGGHTVSVRTSDGAGNVGPAKTLTFQVDQGTGDTGYFQFTYVAPGVGVNVATGNLYVSATDLPDSSANSDIVVNRYYNSEASSGSQQLGRGWTFGVGPDLHLQVSGSTVTVTGPSGWALSFTQQSDGTYAAADTGELRLSQTGSTWSLADTGNGLTYAFSQLGALTGTTDAVSRAFTVATTTVSGILSLAQYALSGGPVANLITNANGTIQKLVDPSGGQQLYSYNANGLLSQYADSTGTTQYWYDSNGHLNSLTLADGTAITVNSDAAGEVSALTVQPPGGAAQQTASFNYSVPGQTTVTYGGGAGTVYDYDVHGAITAQYPVGDTTSPPAPDNVTADYNPTTQAADVTFDEEPSGLAADGQPDADITDVKFRYMLSGGGWSAWTDNPDLVDVPNATSNGTYEVQLQAFDAAGNGSAVTDQVVTAVPGVTLTQQQINALPPDITVGQLETLDPSNTEGAETPPGPTDAQAGAIDPYANVPPSSQQPLPPASESGSQALIDYGTYCDTASVTGPSCPTPPDAESKSPIKAQEEECTLEYYEALAAQVGDAEASTECWGDPNDLVNDNNIPWYYVYRLVKGNPAKTFYVGITKNPAQRCQYHAATKGVTPFQGCQILEVVPGKAIARAVEQFLIEAYGFLPTIRPNTVYDVSNFAPPVVGWLAGNNSALTNKIRSISATRSSSLYCLAISVGYGILQAFPPYVYGFQPPLSHYWWSNFPSRAGCLSPVKNYVANFESMESGRMIHAPPVAQAFEHAGF
jgi:hypothetical protein